MAADVKLTPAQVRVLEMLERERFQDGDERRLEFKKSVLNSLMDLGYVGIAVTQRGYAALARARGVQG